MNWLIYGANGYTGRLIAAEAVRRGMTPILAGRSDEVRRIGAELGVPSMQFDLIDPASVRLHIAKAQLVLHCAGPFSATSKPMVEACIDECTHYLDITGEIDVFAAVHGLGEDARRADVALVPGVGFDVAPSDCLAARLVEALPAATELSLAFASGSGPSPGTAKTAVEGLAGGGRVLRGGRLRAVPLAWKSRDIAFHDRQRHAVTIPWGDVYTAHITTGVPDVEVYMAMKPGQARQLRRLRLLRPLLARAAVQRWIHRRIEARLHGPDARQREQAGMELWGEARSSDGRSVSATMSTPNGYDITVSAALGIVQHLLHEDIEGGFYTPSLLMGAQYAESLPGVTLRFN